MASKHIGTVTRSLMATQKAQPHGSTMTGGGMTIPSPRQANIKPLKTPEEVTSIELLLRQARSRVQGWKKTDRGMQRILSTPILTKQERAMAEHYKRPASKAVILHHVLRLAAHKHIKGDQRQVDFLLDDIVNRLQGATELQIFHAIEFFINENESDFFPQIASLRQKVLSKRIDV